MRRRTFVASLAALAASAGCIENTTVQGSDDQMQKTIDVSDVTTEPGDEDGLTFDVTVVESTITPDASARIELVYENDGANTLTLNLGPDNPTPVFTEENDPGLVLLSDAYDPTRESDECWKPQEEEFPQPAVVRTHQLDPSETVTLAYDVWADPNQEADCIQPGEYGFEPQSGAFTLSVSGEESESQGRK